MQFNHTKEKQPSKMWFSVEDMADYMKNNVVAEKNKTTKLQNLTKELMIPLTREDHLYAITNQGYAIIYDPPGHGDCQFAALTYLLQRIGIHRSPGTLRAEVVRYLEANSTDHEGWPLEMFVPTPWSSYIQQMRQSGTFGDELTLRAVANLFNIEITVVSTHGEDPMAMASPVSNAPLTRFTVGHFAEGQADHYVVLKPDNIHEINDTQSQDEECNVQDELYPDESLESKNSSHQNGNFLCIFFLLLIVAVGSLNID